MKTLKTNGLTPILLTLCLSAGGLTLAETATASSAQSGKESAKDEKGKNRKSDGKDSKKDRGGDKAGKKDGPATTNASGNKDSKSNDGGKKSAPSSADLASGGVVECQMSKASSGLAGVTEASGVAVGRRTAGVLWSHGDSYVGEPTLYAFGANGSAKGKVRVTGVKVADWEDIAVGSCGGSSCVYIADIGDNNGSRRSVTIHRVPEPLPTDAATAPAESFQATFPDGAHDSEAMFVAPSGEVFIITKGETGPSALYRSGSAPKAGSTTQLQKVGVLQAGMVSRAQWITGASASPDGKWVALRTHGSVYFYNADRLMKGDLKDPLRFDASALREPQGEGVALGANGALYLAGEGGGKGTPGTLASGTCKFPA